MKQIINIMMLCILWMTTSAVNAMMPDDGKDRVLPVQEKVYLHFDNNCYFLGDTIWYKAYVVLADDNTPQPLSRVLYVELLNEQGYVMERQQLAVSEKGECHGQFAISDTTFAGHYEIRAYTKYMLNFGYERVASWNSKSWLGFGETVGNLQFDLNEGRPNEQPQIIFNGGAAELMVDEKKINDGESGDIKKLTVKPYDNEYESGFSIDPRGMDKLYRSYPNIFSRVLPVYSRPDSAQNYMRKIMPTKITMGDFEVKWKTEDFDVKFYPEGGTLLEGVECNVAWEALNQELERLNVTGVLLEDGEVIDSIAPYHAGRGMFTFTPKPKMKYRVKFTFGEHEFKIKLPEAEEYGARLIVEQDEEGVYFNVAKHFKEERKLLLNVYCRGKRIKSFVLPNTDVCEEAMYLDDLPEGVNQAVLLDTNGNKFADRLFFVNRTSEAKGKIMVAGMANRAYQPLEKIHLNLLATDAKGHPLPNQTFSVSIRDANQLDPTFATGNILTNMLLESEVKGFIENPDYYFESDDEKHRKALDLLLMIQGWRRYEWQYIEVPELFRLDYIPEQKMVLYGSAMPLRKNIFGKDLGRLQITCSLVNLNDDLKDGDYYKFEGAVEADTAGNFQIAYEPFYGNVKLMLRAKFVKKLDKKNYDLISHDKHILIRKQFFYPQGLKELSWYETHSPEMVKDKKLTWEEFQDDIYASEWIPQVNIKSKRRPHAKRQKDKPVYRADMLDLVNDIWDQGFYDPFFLADEQYPVLEAFSHFENFVRHQYELTPNNRETHISSFAWNSGTIGKDMELNNFLPALNDMTVISDAPRRPTSFEHEHQDRRANGDGPDYGIDSYLNFTTFPKGETRFLKGREYNLQGFTRPAEYYNPDYSKAQLPEIHDYRRTLYWNPDVMTNNHGQASIEFYNSSVCTLLDVSAEGVSRHGEFLVVDE